MFFSKKLNILFIASPKTGSTSIEKLLSSIDPEGEKHRITLDDRTISSTDMRYGVVGHARAFELKNALGDEIYNNLNSFGFVRHPFDKLVSSYFFNKKGVLLNAFKIKGKKKRTIRMINMFLTFLMPRILPFQIWALIFPMKTNKEYFIDPSGQVIVDFIGRTEFLNDDLRSICSVCGIDLSQLEIPHINKSTHDNWRKYFKNRFFYSVMAFKYKADLEFYDKVQANMRVLKNNEHEQA